MSSTVKKDEGTHYICSYEHGLSRVYNIGWLFEILKCNECTEMYSICRPCYITFKCGWDHITSVFKDQEHTVLINLCTVCAAYMLGIKGRISHACVTSKPFFKCYSFAQFWLLSAKKIIYLMIPSGIFYVVMHVVYGKYGGRIRETIIDRW